MRARKAFAPKKPVKPEPQSVAPPAPPVQAPPAPAQTPQRDRALEGLFNALIERVEGIEARPAAAPGPSPHKTVYIDVVRDRDGRIQRLIATTDETKVGKGGEVREDDLRSVISSEYDKRMN